VGSEVEIVAAVWLDGDQGEEGRVDGGPERTLYAMSPDVVVVVVGLL